MRREVNTELVVNSKDNVSPEHTHTQQRQQIESRCQIRPTTQSDRRMLRQGG